MQLVLATFVAILGIVLAIYWMGIVRPEQHAQRQIHRRLKRATAPVDRGTQLAKKTRHLSDVPALNVLLQGAGAVPGALEQRIARAGLRFTVGTLLLSSGCLFLFGWLVTTRLTSLWAVGLVAGVLAAYLPFAWVGAKARKRMLRFEEQFPEAIDLISRALRAGHAFTTGLAMVAEESAEPVKSEFRTLYDQQNFGMPIGDAMREFADRIPLLDARFFVTAVLTQREAGGNLAEILDNLAAVMRERFRVKRQVRVVTAHARITGWVLVFLPLGLAAAVMVTTPSHLRTLLDDPLGIHMIVTAIVLQVVGTLIIRKLVDIEY
jgi:tight adherence protein B